MYLKWTRANRRIYLKQKIENKRYSMKEIRGQMAEYAQANDEVSSQMYQELLDKCKDDMYDRADMQDKLDRPVEDAQIKYKQKLEEVKNIGVYIKLLEDGIEERKQEAAKLKEEIDNLKQEEQEKIIQRQALAQRQLELDEEMADKNLLDQDKLNEKLLELRDKIGKLESEYKTCNASIAFKQMEAKEQRQKAMNIIALATNKFNHKMQTLGEDDQKLPTNKEYRQKVFEKMMEIRDREKSEREVQEKEREEQQKVAEKEEKQQMQEEIERKRETELNKVDEKEQKSKQSRPDKKRDKINDKYDKKQAKLTGDEEPKPIDEEPEKEGIFKKIGNWFKNKFKKQKALPEGQEDMTRWERKEYERTKKVEDAKSFLEEVKVESRPVIHTEPSTKGKEEKEEEIDK